MAAARVQPDAPRAQVAQRFGVSVSFITKFLRRQRTSGSLAPKPAHPWTNGRVERMNRTRKEAAVQRYHYQITDELNQHLQAFLLAHNHAKRLKRLRGLTPHEVVYAQW